MGYTAKNIITQARKFEEASLLLEQKTIEMTKLQNSTNPVSIQRQSTDGYIEPSLALFGFSLELYLKAIFLHENGKPTCGHEIPKIYEKLGSESKTSIKESFENSTQQYLIDNCSFFGENNYSQISFEESLEQLSDLFVKVRYIYEYPKMEKNLSLREPVRQAIINRINQLQIIHYPLD